MKRGPYRPWSLDSREHQSKVQIAARRRPTTAAIRGMLAADYTVVEIARFFGMSRQAVHQRLENDRRRRAARAAAALAARTQPPEARP